MWADPKQVNSCDDDGTSTREFVLSPPWEITRDSRDVRRKLKGTSEILDNLPRMKHSYQRAANTFQTQCLRTKRDFIYILLNCFSIRTSTASVSVNRLGRGISSVQSAGCQILISLISKTKFIFICFRSDRSTDKTADFYANFCFYKHN